MCEFKGCPICEAEASDLCPCDEPEPCTCLDGWILMDDSGNILTQAEFDKLPEDERIKDNCQSCNPARLINGKWIFNDTVCYCHNIKCLHHRGGLCMSAQFNCKDRIK